MLRFNTSTVLKLYAIARHIQPPGGVIFSTDDLILQLNQTELEQMTREATTSAVRPLKHPKMMKKPTNQERIGTELNYLNRVANSGGITSTGNVIDETEVQKKANEKPSDSIIFSDENSNLASMLAKQQQFGYPKRIFESDVPQPSVNQEEFDNYFNYDPAGQIPPRMKYLSSRDIKNKLDSTGTQNV